MAVAYGSSASAVGENSDTVVITKPSSLAAGDMMIAFVLARSGTASWSAPAGWTSKGTVSISNNRFACFVKVATSGDAAASNFTFSGAGASTESSGFIIRLTGSFTDDSNVTGTASASDATADTGDVFVFSTSLTPLADQFLVICCGAEATNASSTTAATASIANSSPTFTSRVFQSQPNGDDNLVVGLTGSRASATAIGDTTVDFDSTGNLTNAGVIVLAIHETSNASVSPAVVDLVSAVQAPSVTGDASISPSVVTMTGAVQAPTVTAGTAKWVNTDKSSAGSITNTDKS